MNKIIQRKMFRIFCREENGKNYYLAFAIRPGLKNMALTEKELELLKHIANINLKPGEQALVLLKNRLGQKQKNVDVYITNTE